jgi:hypothetical protein
VGAAAGAGPVCRHAAVNARNSNIQAHRGMAVIYCALMARLAAFVMAALFAVTPVATATCEAACASRDAHSSTSQHSCHQHLASQQGAAVAAMHICGHGDGPQTTVERVSAGVEMPAVVPAVTLPDPPAKVRPGSIGAVDSSPPTHLNLISQLRV